MNLRPPHQNSTLVILPAVEPFRFSLSFSHHVSPLNVLKQLILYLYLQDEPSFGEEPSGSRRLSPVLPLNVFGRS